MAEQLSQRAAVENVVLTVGNDMMGDDGAGPLLFNLFQHHPVEGWLAIDGGTMPENYIDEVSRLNPCRVWVVDATEMGLAPGEIRAVDEALIAELLIMTTHSLPLNFLIEQLKQDIAEVIFIGIQPDLVSFGFPMSSAVSRAVESLFQQLTTGEENWKFQLL